MALPLPRVQQTDHVVPLLAHANRLFRGENQRRTLSTSRKVRPNGRNMAIGPRIPAALLTLCVVGAVCAGCSESDDADTPSTTAAVRVSDGPDAFTPIVGTVDFAPVPFVGSDGRTHLVYELAVTNFTRGRTTVDGVQILDADTGAVIDDLDATETHQRLQPAGSRDSAAGLEPGESGTIFVHVTLDDSVPKNLVHKVTSTAEAAPPEARTSTAELGPTPVDTRTLPVLAAPLRGERYIAADACCDASRHTRALLP